MSLEFEVSIHPARRFSGKRARRQAFYDRQRLARAFRRIIAANRSEANDAAFVQAFLDVLVHGAAYIELQPSGEAHRVDPSAMRH